MYVSLSVNLSSVGDTASNDNAMMYNRIFLQRHSLRNYSISQTQIRRYLSQTIVSLKPTLTRALGGAREARFVGPSKINISSLRSGVCKHNGKIFSVRNSSNIATIQRSQSPIDVNTNVINNILLFKYDRPKFFKFLNVFAPLQGIFWFGIAYISYKYLPKRDMNNQSLSEYASDNIILVLSVILSVITGTFGSLLLWAFTARSVRYLILHKGGKTATFITYNPLKKNSRIIVPVTNISCKISRTKMLNYLPIKVKGHRFFYIIDAGGEFLNHKIFDNTIMLKNMFD